MAEQQKHPEEKRFFHKGVDYDSEEELIQPDSGMAIDSCNMRSSSGTQNRGARKKIKGEVVEYPAVDNACFDGTGGALSPTYFCIGTEYINRSKFEVWADQDGVLPTLIRIDGVIVCRSEDLPLTAAHPLQIDKNENCPGGEVYLTDYNVPPMVFNVLDLRRNGGLEPGFECTNKYFSGFQYDEYVLSTKISQNTPVFIQLTGDQSIMDNVFAPDENPGLPVGYYSYSVRYVTEAGDRSQRSQLTPQIPVVRSFGFDCGPEFPGTKTFTGPANIEAATAYGIHMMLRVDNRLNYDFIEVIRNKWNAEDPIGTPPITEIVGFIDIEPGELSVRNILDLNGFESTLNAEEISEVMTSIKRAKGIRYHERKLYLGNIEYNSKVVDDSSYSLLDGNAIEPCIRKINRDGHTNPYKATYFKHLMTDEKYGWGFLLWDENGGYTFAEDIDGFESFKQPTRRSALTPIQEDLSYYGSPLAATTVATVDNVFEVFDLENAYAKSNIDLFFNIADRGNKAQSNMEDYAQVPGDWVNGIGQVQIPEIGFRPFRPTRHGDDSCNGHDYIINPEVGTNGEWKTYRPNGFGPNYYAHGVAFKGFNTLPEWCTGFSIVRTRPAKRVMAQGIGMYKLNSSGNSLGANTTKDLNKMWCYFPDGDPLTGIDPDLYDRILESPESYRIEAVSPLGFFSEVYHFRNDSDIFDFQASRDEGIDMVTYARVIREVFEGGVPDINPFETNNMGIAGGDGNRYTAFGKWRSSSSSSVPQFAGNQKVGDFGITSINQIPNLKGRGNYVEIQLDENIYQTGQTGGPTSESPAVRAWHEPFYIINIVKVNADVPDQNIKEFHNGGHVQKLKSRIGVANNEDEQIFQIVDERWEDFTHYEEAIPEAVRSTNQFLIPLERFIYVKDEIGNTYRWLNVNEKTQPEINTILQAIEDNGFYEATDSSGTYQVYGIYTTEEETIGSAPTFRIRFGFDYDEFSFSSQVPSSGWQIFVHYDNRIPVRVFTGDTWINESIWAPIDLKYNANGEPETPNDDFGMNLPFPIQEYHVNPFTIIYNNTGVINSIQDRSRMRFDTDNGARPARVRQMINMFTCESRINLSMFYNLEDPLESNQQSFPKKGYILRPYKWSPASDEDFLDDNKVFQSYESEYGKEWYNWGYGGFRFLPQVNIDLSKKNGDGRSFSSVPQVGFEEQNLFCTRIIWTPDRPVNAQNTPSVKTFPELNFRDISDNNGGIKMLWSALTQQAGNSLYALTDSGISMLLVDKRMLSDADGGDLSYMQSINQGVVADRWISQEIGLTDEFWRSAADFDNALFFASRHGIFKFEENQITPILRLGYFSKMYEPLELLSSDYTDHITAGYNPLHNEYMLTFERRNRLINEPVYPVDFRGWYVIDEDPQDYEIPGYFLGGEYNIIETLENDALMFMPEVEYDIQSGIILGHYNFFFLTHSVTICNHPNAQYNLKVKFKSEPDVITTLELEPGECYTFSHYELIQAQGGEFNPFSKGHPYFEYELSNPVVPDQFFDGCNTVIFDNLESHWQGSTSHIYDQYLRVNNEMYGMRDGITYRLDKGNVLNGQLIEAWLIGTCVGIQEDAKEFIRIRVNSDNKPFSIRFYLNKSDATADNAVCELSFDQIKNRRGFEQYVPRQIQNRLRCQGRILFYRIMHNLDEDFKVVTSEVQFKSLKGHG
jgi:hypothetical protein